MLDADVVEVSGPVDGRHQVRLGDEDDVAGAALAAYVARQGAVAARRLSVAAAQDSQSRGLDRPQRLSPFASLQAVFAVAQKSEVAIFHPGKQRERFAQIPRVELRAQGTQFLR